MILRDQDDKIITGKANPTDQITVEATFDKSTYTNYSFKINNENELPDRVDGNKIVKTIPSLEDITSIEIFATAQTEQGDQINSIVCRRIVDVQTSVSSMVTDMSALTEQQTDGTTKISQILISVGQLNSDNIKIRYSFSSGFSTLTAIDGITVESARGGISMVKLDLYDESNFSEQSFNILNNHTGELDITAEVFVDDQNIGSASTQVNFSSQQDPDPEDNNTPASNFSVTKSSTQSCVERTSPENETSFTISIKNNRQEQASNSTPDQIISVKDKLPLGFVYTNNSTKINGTSSQDSGLVTITNIGNTQEIVWQPSSPWIVDQGNTLTITFDSTASATTIVGKRFNEVVINPTEVPLDSSTLRSESPIIVAQDCDNITDEEREPIPETGIFDNFVVRISLGILIIVTGLLIYIRPEGNILSEIIVKSKTYDKFEMAKYKVTNPKKYFEETLIRKTSREKK
jgi:hypothetical protein